MLQKYFKQLLKIEREGDPKVKGLPSSSFYRLPSFCCVIIKKDSYSFVKQENSYCLFGKFLLSLYYHIEK